MAVSISTIASLVASAPLGLLTAHQWYSDFPTNSDATFAGTGYFSGGDLPFGLIYEVHSLPAATPFRWNESIVFSQAWAHVVNNATILSGYSSSLPAEEFFLNRPRGLLRFSEPTTTSIAVETVDASFLELWGLYIDVPLRDPVQPSWTATSTTPNLLDPYAQGASYTGLVDTGAITLSPAAVGAQIDVAVLPDYAGQIAGTPVSVFDVGWIAWGDGFGYREREFIASQAFQTFPRRPAWAPVIAYTLNPGVVIAITELIDRSAPGEGRLP